MKYTTKFSHLPKLILSSAGLTSGSVVHFASGGSGGAGTKNQQQQQQPRPQPASAASAASALDRDKDLTGNLELGELGQLTITNDNESSFDVCDAFGLFRDDDNPAFFVLSANQRSQGSIPEDVERQIYVKESL